MHRFDSRLDVLRRHPLVVDLALAAGLYAFSMAVWFRSWSLEGSNRPGLAGILTSAVVFGALVWRRRWPVAALVAALAGTVLSLTVGRGQEWSVIGATMVALFTVASIKGGRTSLLVGGVAVLVLGAVQAAVKPTSWFGAEMVAVIALSALALATGDAARSRRAYIAEVEERAGRAELTREQEAQRRVTEERLRIARDLHDVLGHQIALINVEAGVADHVLDRDPARAREALAHIRQAGRSALEELRDTIGLLRQPGDPAAPTEPTAGLASLDDLLASFRRSGLEIEQEVEGEIRPLPPPTDVAAYRIIQESLTNVRKHAGDATAVVHLAYGPAALRVVVEDDGAGAPGRPAEGNGVGGHGIEGMRERLGMIGGKLEAGPRAGRGFRVSATLPLPGNGGG